MKKYYLLTFLIAVGIMIMPSLYLATAIEFPNPLEYATLEELIDAIIAFIFTAVMILAPIMILIGAFFLMTAAGEPAKVKKANNIFLYTAIGVIIALMGKGLISAIMGFLGTS